MTAALLFFLGVSFGAVSGAFLSRGLFRRRITESRKVLPGQWFRIPRAGEFRVDSVGGNPVEVAGSFFLTGNRATYPLLDFLANAEPCMPPSPPLAGSLWVLPGVGKVKVVDVSEILRTVRYVPAGRPASYSDSLTSSLGEFMNAAEPADEEGPA